MRGGRARLLAALCALCALWAGSAGLRAQINTDRVLLMGRNALYYEDYVLAIQRFNMVIGAKPWLGEPYFYRGLAKFYLEDYRGAEADCGEAIERNPYVASHFALRALCRVNQGRYAPAEEDYRSSLSIDPRDKAAWHNIVLCQMELKEYARADSSLDAMIRQWPREAGHYTLKAQVALAEGDSARAEDWVGRALEANAYEGQAWSLKALFQAGRGEYAGAEASLDKAITQTPRAAGLYVNRALARYNQDNLRGAMSDYDAAVDLDGDNYLAHYNRALLRASVGEDNRAIEDFNFVLRLEPDNTIALYNRALLLDNVGDYKGAIRDISAVIRDYPEFWEGYRRRAAIRRKIGDTYGAERDEFKVLKARMAVATGTYKGGRRTRRKSERAIEDYDKLVEEDTRETENEYASEYRGRVQNRQAELRPEPLYVLSYYKRDSDLRLYAPYCPELEGLNASRALPAALFLTDSERPMTEEQTRGHLSSAAEVTERLESAPGDRALLLRRALDYYHTRDFENAVADMNTLLRDSAADPLALALRAQCRVAQLEVSRSSAPSDDQRLGWLMALQDYNRAAALSPGCAALRYDAGYVMIQLGDYSGAAEALGQALETDSRFPSAYYSRGVAYLLAGRTQEGLSDLSQAGEYGLYSAYNLIKKYSAQKK